MPTYEYSCKSCGEHLEVVQSFKDVALTECPNCGGNLRKVFGNIGIVFKGSGFYRNDSRPGQSTGKPAAAGGTGPESTAAASSDAAKPAASESTATEKTAASAAPAASTSTTSSSSSSSSAAAAS
jgi:putative FmdB family regulatory protein